MISTLVDSNVLIDVIDAAGGDVSWSVNWLKQAADAGRVVVNQIVVAEIAIGFDDAPDAERFLALVELGREALPWRAAFHAGQAHAQYRRRGGLRERTLPDFLIGAHATLKGHRLLTRDARRYREYFPSLEIIAPDTHP